MPCAVTTGFGDLHDHGTQALKRATRTLPGQKQSGHKLHDRRVPVLDENGACSQMLEITMNSKWKFSALVLGLVLLLNAPAFAQNHRGGPPPHGGPGSGPSGAAPEVDPSLAIAGISFLAGSLAVLRSRLRK